MTMTKALLAAAVFAGSIAFAGGQSFAATVEDPAFSPDGKQMKCAFIAELGGYRCIPVGQPGSIAGDGDGAAGGNGLNFDLMLKGIELDIDFDVKV